LASVSADLLYDESSTSRAGGVLAQMDFIPTLVHQLQDHPKKVIESFEKIRESITQPSGVRFSVTGNILNIKKPRSVWSKYFGNLKETPLTPVPLSSQTLSVTGKNPTKKAIVVRLPSIESSHVSHTTKGLQGYTNPELPAMRITLEVMNATESYLWRYIRGSGLAYGAYVSNDTEAGLLSFQLSRSSNYLGAFEQAAKVVQGLVDGSIPFDETALDAAKSSVVFAVANGVSTPGRAALSSFSNQALKGVSQNYTIDQLEKYQAVTKEDVLECLQTHFLRLFDPRTSVAIVVTAPGKTEEIADALGKKGFQVDKKTIEVEEGNEGEESGSEEDGSSSEDEK